MENISPHSASTSTTLEAIRYNRTLCELSVLNQLLLPHEVVYEPCQNADMACDAINTMKVRGAPAIALVAILALGCSIARTSFFESKDLVDFIKKELHLLKKTRPTAVNLFNACETFEKLATEGLERRLKPHGIIELYLESAHAFFCKDLEDNRTMAAVGAQALAAHCTPYNERPLRVLTHCNTGSLATAGYGTALGVIRYLQEIEKLECAFATETRPYNQGARLTAFELVYEKIPAALITDSMVSALMAQGKVDAVLVGADRIARNGDTANKIGTYQIAVAAAYHKIPFFVVAPVTSIDFELPSGAGIPIEERPARELTHIGEIPLAAPGIGVWNPGFDVTPASLITAIITPEGWKIPCQLTDLMPLSPTA